MPADSTATRDATAPACRVALRGAVSLVALALAGCFDLGGIPPPPPDVPPPPEGGLGDGGVYEVEIASLVFRPNPLDPVPPGSIVRFTNLDSVPHTVTDSRPEDPAAGLEYDCPLPGYGAVCEWTFPEPGEFEYFCRTHPTTTVGSKVVVR